jgi:LacI family transcriptional regulator
MEVNICGIYDNVNATSAWVKNTISKRKIAIMLDLDWLYRHHTDVFAGIQKYARAEGRWQCIVDEYVHEQLPTNPKGPLPYDGIIARTTHDLAQRAGACGVPVVNVWHNSPALGVHNVFADMREAGRNAAHHLMDRGFRRFTCLSARRDRADAEIVSGFNQALEEAELVCHSVRCSREYTRDVKAWRQFQKTLDDWMDTWELPIAVLVALPSACSRHVTNAMRRRGIRIPQDVALVAGTNEPAICLDPEPALSSIDINFKRVGFESAQMLDRLMDGQTLSDRTVHVRTDGIVGRQSTDFYAVDDPMISKALRYIAEQIGKPFTINSIADTIHSSRRTLERRFMQATGRSVSQEIRRLRIERAKRLLLDTDLPVKQIAGRCGFESRTNLFQVFKALTGVSPTAYRASVDPIK